MSLTKPKEIAQQRLDLEDWLVLLSSIDTDQKYWTKNFLASTAYILKGFAATGLGGTSPATVAVDSSTLINPENSGTFSWFVGASGASNLSVPLTASSRNYLELQIGSADGTPLNKAFWDPSANGGSGGEFNQTVNTVTSLNISVVVNTTGFSGSSDKLPLAIIDTDSGNVIKLILDKRNLFFRLGTPSTPLNSFSWTNSQLESPLALVLTGVAGTFTAGETITIGASITAEVQTGGTTSITAILLSADGIASGNTVTGGTSGATGTLSTVSASFTAADKGINTFKDSVNALATQIKNSQGTRFWFNKPWATGKNSKEANNMILSGGGTVSWGVTGTTTLNFTSTINFNIVGRSTTYTLAAASNSLTDGQCLYVTIPETTTAALTGTVALLSAVPVNPEGTSFAAGIQVIAYRSGSTVYGLQGFPTLGLGESGLINKSALTDESVTAGETLVANDFIYISSGAGVDSGRTAGRAYKADTGTTNGSVRGQVLGVVTVGNTSGNSAKILVLGKLNTFSALTVGSVYYLDPATPGAITATRPTKIDQYVMPVGIATASTDLYLTLEVSVIKNYGATESVTAGENSALNDFIYISSGAGVDSGRTAGRAYKADTGTTNGSVRGQVLGVVTGAVSTGATEQISVFGRVTGLSGLSQGTYYYLDPATPGAITATRPSTVGQYIQPIGIALSSSTLYLILGPAVIIGATLATEIIVGETSGPITLTSADSGKNFLVDTTLGAITFNLPANTAGLNFKFYDVKNNFDLNAVTLHRVGSENINFLASDYILEASGGSWKILGDATDWWVS